MFRTLISNLLICRVIYIFGKNLPTTIILIIILSIQFEWMFFNLGRTKYFLWVPLFDLTLLQIYFRFHLHNFRYGMVTLNRYHYQFLHGLQHSW